MEISINMVPNKIVDAGFTVPPGHQVVMTFIPSGLSEATKSQISEGKDKWKKGGGSRRRK